MSASAPGSKKISRAAGRPATRKRTTSPGPEIVSTKPGAPSTSTTPTAVAATSRPSISASTIVPAGAGCPLRITRPRIVWTRFAVWPVTWAVRSRGSAAAGAPSTTPVAPASTRTPSPALPAARPAGVMPMRLFWIVTSWVPSPATTTPGPSLAVIVTPCMAPIATRAEPSSMLDAGAVAGQRDAVDGDVLGAGDVDRDAGHAADREPVDGDRRRAQDEARRAGGQAVAHDGRRAGEAHVAARDRRQRRRQADAEPGVDEDRARAGGRPVGGRLVDGDDGGAQAARAGGRVALDDQRRGVQQAGGGQRVDAAVAGIVVRAGRRQVGGGAGQRVTQHLAFAIGPAAVFGQQLRPRLEQQGRQRRDVRRGRAGAEERAMRSRRCP